MTKVLTLADVAAFDGTEVAYLVDPGSTPRDRKATLIQILAALLPARLGSLRVSAAGDGTQINAIYRGTVAGYTTAIATVTAATITLAITGVLIGDQVMVSPVDADTDGLIITARVIVNGTVTIRYYNPTAASKTAPTHNLAMTVIR